MRKTATDAPIHTLTRLRADSQRGRTARVALWLMQIAFAAIFLMAGGSRLAGPPAMVRPFDAIGWGQWFPSVTGDTQVVSALALLPVPTMLAAIATELSVVHRSPMLPPVPSVGTIAVARPRRHQLRNARSNHCIFRSDYRMTANEAAIRKAYQVAEAQDIAGWVNSFTDDGTFTDESIGVTYRGPTELGRTVEIYARAFPDMHRELHAFYVIGDTVVVELALQGTHQGSLELPAETFPATGKRMDAPCCDVFQLRAGKIQSFNCYPSGTVIQTQLGLRPGRTERQAV